MALRLRTENPDKKIMKGRFLIISSLVVTALAIVSLGALYYVALYTPYGINSLVNKLNQSEYLVLENVHGTLGEGFSFGKITFETERHHFEFISGEVKYDSLSNLFNSEEWNVESIITEKANFTFKKSKFSEISYSDINKKQIRQSFESVQSVLSYIPAKVLIKKFLIKTSDIFDSEKLSARTAEILFEGLEPIDGSIKVKNFSVVSSHIDAYGLDAEIGDRLNIIAGPKGIDGYFKKPLLGMLKKDIKFRIYGELPVNQSPVHLSLADDRMRFEFTQDTFKLLFQEFRPYLWIETLPSIERITGEFDVMNIEDLSEVKSRLLVRFYNRDFMFGLGSKMGISERPPLDEMKPEQVDNFAEQGIPLYYRNGNEIFELRFLYKHLIKYDSLSRAMIIRANKDFANVEGVLSNLLYGLELDRLPVAQKQEVLSEAGRFIPTIDLAEAMALLDKENGDNELKRSTASTKE